MKRYARQISVAGVGERGQARITSAEVTVDGSGLDAEVCALYLAGSGVGLLAVHVSLVDRCRALNREITVIGHERGGAVCAVRFDAAVFSPDENSSELERGSIAARWVLARAIGFDEARS